jgi:hypothetical protein
MEKRVGMPAKVIPRPAVDQDVVDHLARVLSTHRCALRVDPATMGGDFGSVVAQLEGRADLIVRHLANNIPAHQRRDAHIFFCEDEAYGAFAFICRYNYIVLKIGLALRLTHFCECMMSTRELWPDVSDEAVRQGLAVVFMGECFDFVVRHEFAHLVLGHLDADGRAARTNPIAAQALELAADGHAAIWGLEKLGRITDMIHRLPSGARGGFREFLRTRDDTILNYLLAIYFVFRIMDEGPWDDSTLARRRHPPASMRFHAVCIHLHEQYERIGDKEALDQFLHAQQDIWSTGETIFASTLDREPDATLLDRTMSDACEELYNHMSDQARGLAPHFFGLA